MHKSIMHPANGLESMTSIRIYVMCTRWCKSREWGHWRWCESREWGHWRWCKSREWGHWRPSVRQVYKIVPLVMHVSVFINFKLDEEGRVSWKKIMPRQSGGLDGQTVLLPFDVCMWQSKMVKTSEDGKTQKNTGVGIKIARKTIRSYEKFIPHSLLNCWISVCHFSITVVLWKSQQPPFQCLFIASLITESEQY